VGITLYTAGSCTPCQEIKKIIAENPPAGVEVVDIETDAGFDRFAAEVLKAGDGAVPSAYQDGKKCAILVDEESKSIAFDCNMEPPAPTPDPPSDPPA